MNGCMGGKAEGYLCDGYLYLLKEPVKEKLLRSLEVQNAPVFKGQDPVWNEMALALAGAGLITTKAGAKEAGKKSCLFTIKTPQGQEKVIAIPVTSLAPHLTNQMAAKPIFPRSRFYSAMKLYGIDIGYGFTKVAGVDRIPRVIPSIVGSNEELSYRSDIGDRIKIAPLTLNGHSYLVGEAAKRFSRHRYRIFDSTWAESPYYLLLFVSALMMMKIDKSADEPAAVVTGLPVSHYTQERVKQLQNLLGQAHSVQTLSGENSVKVERVKVIPQPFGSYFDLLLNDEGKLKDPEKIRERVGIIDIGFQTTDLAMATPQFVEASSGSLEVGVRSVADQLSRDLSSQLLHHARYHRGGGGFASEISENLWREYRSF